MAYVITTACVSVCETGCVKQCPVDAISGPIPPEQLRAVPRPKRAELFPGARMFIDPDVCICCGACQPVCPVGAIFAEDDLAPDQRHHAVENARFFGRS